MSVRDFPEDRSAAIRLSVICNTESLPKAQTVQTRLKSYEVLMLSIMLASEQQNCENACEFFRLLLHREWNRRKNLGKPLSSDYQTAFRPGGCPKGLKRKKRKKK